MPIEQEILELKKQIRELKNRLDAFDYSDRYIFQKDIQFPNGRKMIFGRGENTVDGIKIASDTDQKIGFYGADGTGQQTSPTYPGLITISGTGDDANINTNFQRLESYIDDIIGVLDTLGLTA